MWAHNLHGENSSTQVRLASLSNASASLRRSLALVLACTFPSFHRELSLNHLSPFNHKATTRCNSCRANRLVNRPGPSRLSLQLFDMFGMLMVCLDGLRSLLGLTLADAHDRCSLAIKGSRVNHTATASGISKPQRYSLLK
jgi:hypothetical protein